MYIYIGYSGEKTTPLSKKYFDMMSSIELKIFFEKNYLSNY